MSIIIFIIVLALLILVHELGHFWAAKTSGIRVDEFGLGFPPKFFSWKPKKSETQYSLNWIPFGGFVKIFGEDPDDESIEGPDKDRSFVHKPKLIQVWVLASGVICNALFAWLLISIGFMIGFPASATTESKYVVEDPQVMVITVLPEGPAASAGLAQGDTIKKLEVDGEELSGTDVRVSSIREFLSTYADLPIELTYVRGDAEEMVVVTPITGIVEDQAAIGVALDSVGTVTLAPHKAVWEGLTTTVRLTGLTAVGLFSFFRDAFTGAADFAQVAGPVGIVGLVGNAVAQGFVQLLIFTALISINLAIINLIPFPALDGGRILFVLIESLKGSPINPKVVNTLNMVGFGLLILLMVAITYNDIVRLVSG